MDNTTNIDSETGEIVSVAIEQSELDQLAILVRDAVGFDAARGDSVNIINSAFAVKEAPEVVPMEELESVLENASNGTVVTSRYFLQPIEELAKKHGVRAVAVNEGAQRQLLLRAHLGIHPGRSEKGRPARRGRAGAAGENTAAAAPRRARHHAPRRAQAVCAPGAPRRT